jgi:hypothetical protein
MKKNLATVIVLGLFSASAFADNGLSCTASKILFGNFIKIGEVITFNAARSSVTSLGQVIPCEPAPAGLAQPLNASLLLGCGQDNDRALFIFSQDGKTVTLQDIAAYSCSAL